MARKFQHTAARRRLPGFARRARCRFQSFNTQPPEGGCVRVLGCDATAPVSTHSRPKAAACLCCGKVIPVRVSTHSRPKAAAAPAPTVNLLRLVSTHSRPKAAALSGVLLLSSRVFQHTAARRRLPGECIAAPAHRCSFNTQPPEGGCMRGGLRCLIFSSFNTQPPKGGCFIARLQPGGEVAFQHTAARRRLQSNRNPG